MHGTDRVCVRICEYIVKVTGIIKIAVKYTFRKIHGFFTYKLVGYLFPRDCT